MELKKLTELAHTREHLDRTNRERDNLIAQRDRLIAEALASGATWVQVQEAAGLSPRGLALAIRRAS